MPYCILRTAKLKTSANIAASLSHTFRDRATDNADPARKAQNEPSDRRTAAEVLSGIKARWPNKHRRDAVLCIEYLIAASPEYFQEGQTGAAYFEAAKQWLIDRHGAENPIFSAIHRDELTPHVVAYVAPIHEGRLNAKHWLGGKAKLSTMQTEFAQKVAQRFGLDRGIEGSKARHTTVREFYAAINAPEPAVPRVEVSTPPLLGRESWAKKEEARIAAALQPVLNDAAKAAKWGRFQDKGRREAQATAKQQAEMAKAAQAEANKLQAANRRLQGDLAAWARVYNNGLTNDQAAWLIEMADQMREENQIATSQEANATAEHPHQDDGQTMGISAAP
jgi:Plasmid recombination enzyme